MSEQPPSLQHPYTRPRRLRAHTALRAMAQEHHLRPEDFIVPLFVIEGRAKREAIPSMPGYERLSLDELEKQAKQLASLGLQSVLLFAKVPDAKKDNAGTEALNPKGLLPEAIRRVKAAAPQLAVMSDVALDPYSSYGHDGIVEEGQILNDPTVEVLAQMSLVHAEAGADVIAPSDMMDGRIGAIRRALEGAGHHHMAIMAYTAKYASCFYGPFRDALDSAPGFGDKKTYQMNPANRRAALLEAQLDVQEGADIVMVKPGMPYLDILREVSDAVPVPVSVYQVSGEYAMIKAAAQQGWLEHDAAMLESLLAFKRAGASMIATYFAEEAVKLLN